MKRELTMKRVLAALAIGAAGLAGPAQAEDAKTFSAVYSVTAKGIKAGEFSLAMTLGESAYAATADRRMTGFVRTLVGDSQDYHYEANGLITAKGLKPIAYQHQGGKRDRLVKVAFTGDDVVTTATPSMSMGDPPATRAQKKGSLDFLSSFATMVAPPAGGDPCDRTIKVFDGRARFDFVMARNGSEKLRHGPWKGEAIRCTVQYKPIAGFRDPEEPATLTFIFAPLDGGLYAPVRIQMPTDDVGVVTLEMKSFKAG